MQDIAGMNVFQRFLERGFKETEVQWQGMPILKKGDLLLVRTREDTIHARNLDELNATHMVFASRHKAESGIATLTVHHTGIFGLAGLHGGNSHELCWNSPNATRNIYLEMLNNPYEKYQVSLEATHHGPTEFRTPLTFVELGSSEENWKDENAADFLADCIIRGLAKGEKVRHVVGIGGNHYAATFSPMEKDMAFGHICPKYSQGFLDGAMLKQMCEKSHTGHAVIDGKGVKSKAGLKSIIETAGFTFDVV